MKNMTDKQKKTMLVRAIIFAEGLCIGLMVNQHNKNKSNIKSAYNKGYITGCIDTTNVCLKTIKETNNKETK